MAILQCIIHPLNTALNMNIMNLIVNFHIVTNKDFEIF